MSILKRTGTDPNCELFTIRLHHGGKISGNKYVSYVGGDVDHVDNCNAEKMSLHEISCTVEDLGHHDTITYYYLEPYKDMSNGLRELCCDGDINNFCNWAYKFKVMEVYCDHNIEEEVNEIIQNSPLVRQTHDKSISGVLIEEIDGNGDIVRLKSVDRVSNVNKEGEDDNESDSDSDVDHFSDDEEFCNDEHMLEDLIVDLESNEGAYAGVDNLAQQTTEVELAAHKSVAVDDIVQKPIGDDTYSQQITGAEESSQQPVGVNVSSQQHNSHQYQHQPQQLSRRKEVQRRRESTGTRTTSITASNIDVQHALGEDDIPEELHSDGGSTNDDNHEWVVKPYTNENERVRAKCKGPCKWFVYASVEKALGTKDLVVKTLNDEHTNCSHAWKNKNITAAWLADRYLERVRANINILIRAIRQAVDEDYKAEITRVVAYKARALAVKKIMGSAADQYKQIWRYCDEIKKTHPNITMEVFFTPFREPGCNPKFMILYSCLGPLKQGFKDGCRPIIGLDGCHLKGIRDYLMERIQKRIAALAKYSGPIGTKMHKIIEDRVKESRLWKPIWNAADGYKVKGPNGVQLAVHLKKKLCTCNLWDVSGIPCCHAITAIHRTGGDSQKGVDICYNKDLFFKIYENVLQPISWPSLQPDSSMLELDPPIVLVQPGRPRKARMRDITEGKNHGKKLRRRIVIHCSNCGVAGHNAASCKVVVDSVDQQQGDAQEASGGIQQGDEQQASNLQGNNL
ncbi:hypothetical protein ACH5RR_026764 [Cinchona calisaya]|uniref:SWIM-type domain-containing protein n=1 Tax=Cinchona calisaya TaxID=153742 RepID=A0ABD2Z3I3_9GENT